MTQVALEGRVDKPEANRSPAPDSEFDEPARHAAHAADDAEPDVKQAARPNSIAGFVDQLEELKTRPA